MVCEEVNKQRGGEVEGVGVVFLWRACLIETTRCGVAPTQRISSQRGRKKY